MADDLVECVARQQRRDLDFRDPHLRPIHLGSTQTTPHGRCALYLSLLQRLGCDLGKRGKQIVDHAAAVGLDFDSHGHARR